MGVDITIPRNLEHDLPFFYMKAALRRKGYGLGWAIAYASEDAYQYDPATGKASVDLRFSESNLGGALAFLFIFLAGGFLR